MKPILLSALFALLLTAATAQQPEHYSRAKINLDANGHTLRDLSTLGIAVDHGQYKKNTFFTSDFSAHEIDLAKKAGFKVDIIIDDVVKHYQDQNKKKAEKTTAAISCSGVPDVVPSHFHLGSYGGYFTYTELLNIIDSMRLLYPGIISVKQPISTFTTIEGRPIYWIRISNNPTVDQPAKPQMLVTALHHAREPESISSTVFYLWYLLEHYSTDARIKAIVDNTELYFVPCLNPDGYIYNITSSPGGGGLWRKNMRDNLDGTYGVDLNRNYGYNWGYDDIGSSPMTSSDTYRGTAAFSEPETQAIKWFAEHHHFMLTLNYHTFNNDILYPWSYIPSLLTPDSATFFSMGEFLTEENHYRFGTCNQVLNYITNGDSNDWMYGDISGKPKIYAMTPEIGSSDDGFYPPDYMIIPNSQANLMANINTASLLLPFADIHHTDNKILTSASGYLHYDLQRLGFTDGATYSVTITPLDGWMTVPAMPKVYTGLALLQHAIDSISYTLIPSTPNGQLVSYTLNVNNGLYDTHDTVQFYYGKYYSVSTPSTNTLTDWINSGWGLCTTSYYTPPASIKSSPVCADNYADLADITISTAAPIDLTHSIEAYLQFYAKWDVETNFDYVTVSASVVGSGFWQPLCGRYTRPAPGISIPIYDALRPGWSQEEMDLRDFLGQQINIQYELVSDPAVNLDGYYFDDVKVTTVVNATLAEKNPAANVPALSVFPNPANSEFTVSVTGSASTQPLSAALYDCLGRELRHFAIDKPTATIDAHQLPAGVYYLKVSDDGEALPVQKVVIQK